MQGFFVGVGRGQVVVQGLLVRGFGVLTHGVGLRVVCMGLGLVVHGFEI